MNNEDLKTYCLEHAGEEMTAEALAFLRHHPDLAREVEQLAAIQRLIGLKHYEQPAPGSAERCLRAVQARIEAHEQDTLGSRLRTWFTFASPSPAYAWGVAALALAVLGSVVFWRGDVNQAGTVAVLDAPGTLLEPVVRELALPEPDVLAPSMLLAAEEPTATNESLIATSEPVIQKPIIMLRVSAEEFQSGRSGLTFGGDSSFPASYEP